MSRLQDILRHNSDFVESGQYEEFVTDKYPDKKMVILTCMDTRLVELLPRAMNLRNGDAKIIKCAGAIVSHPFGSIMRSILIAVYQLGAKEVFVVGHHDCGMTGLSSSDILEKVRSQGIRDEVLQTVIHSGINLERWLKGFDHVSDGVVKSVSLIRNHPLLPPDILVHGLIIDPTTGKIEMVMEEQSNH